MSGSPKKILFITGSFGVGGLQRQMTEVIRNLPDKYEVYLITKNLEAYYFDQLKYKLTSCYSLGKAHFSLFDIFPIYNKIREFNPDIIFSWSRITSHFCLLIKILSGLHFRLINGSIRDAPVRLKALFKLESFLYNLYNFVVANSYAGLRAYHQFGKRNRYVLYNGFDLSRIPNISGAEAREKLNFPQDKFIVPMVGGLRNAKDHSTFILAAKECALADNSIVFYIVGDGSNKPKLMALVKQYALTNVIFLGNRSDVELIFKASDVSVLCSTNPVTGNYHGEGISNSIMESLASGVPVIATDSGGTREIITEGFNGFLVGFGDFKSVAEKILLLRKDMQLLTALSQNAKNSLVKFDLKNMIAEFEKIINARSSQ